MQHNQEEYGAPSSTVGRSPYLPPKAPVTEPAVKHAARWRWFFVPFGHATLTFTLLIGWWWLEARPVDEPAANVVREASWIWRMVTEALFQGGILLVATLVALWALPRIFFRHAIYVSIASALAGYAVDWGAYLLFGSRTYNGERLDKVVVTYGVVLLLSSVAIRRLGRKGN